VTLAAVTWETLGVGSYVTVDGQVPGGISVTQGSGAGALVDIQRGVSYVTIRYVDLAGPAETRRVSKAATTATLIPRHGTAAITSPSIISRCNIRASMVAATLVWAMRVDDSVWEYNEFYDNDAIDSGSDTPQRMSPQHRGHGKLHERDVFVTTWFATTPPRASCTSGATVALGISTATCGAIAWAGVPMLGARVSRRRQRACVLLQQHHGGFVANRPSGQR